MRGRRFIGLMAAVVFATTLMFGMQAPAAEARGSHGAFRGGFRHGGSGHFGFRHGGFRDHFFRRGHHFRGSRAFVGVGLGFFGVPYAYSAYYPAYPSYPVYSYAPYPAYYGPCYAYDAYGRCVSYWPAGGYYYPY